MPPKEPEVNINLPQDIINTDVKEDEFIEEEEPKQQQRPEHRFTLPNAENTSGSRYNPNRDQDQDQEEEEPTIDLGIDWDAKENSSEKLVHFIMADRQQRRQELEIIEEQRQRLEEQNLMAFQ